MKRDLPDFEAETRQAQRDESPSLSLWVMTESGVVPHPLPRRGEVVIGRSERCDVRIEDPDVSRRHARLVIGDDLVVEDLGSTNGTRIGGRLLNKNQRAVIHCGELVDFGTSALMVRGPTPAAQTPPAAASWRESLMPLLERLASSLIHVLLLGETGVGKEVTADSLHRLSGRAHQPFLKLNCAAFSETLLESELFGYERGAFTGALQSKPGLLAAANGGTVFLDEVGELPLGIQAKLLRVIDASELLPLGALKPRQIDVRIISATNRDLEEEVDAGRFRRDLYFRLNGMSVEVPPLRKRLDEIEPLARMFLERASGGSPPPLSRAAIEKLRAYSWPGNIRELKNVIERALILSAGAGIEPEHLPLAPPQPSAAEAPVSEAIDAEHARVLDALQKTHGNQTRAAKLLGISRRTLVTKLDRYKVPRPRRED